MRKRQIGILGGSFNPVHCGHMMLAQYIAEFTDIEQVLLMLSPQNPLKDSSGLISDKLRMNMLEIACSSTTKIAPCDHELSMPIPSYTASTLNALSRENPLCEFTLIIGSDNWLLFDKWRDFDFIINNFRIMIYPRPGFEIIHSKLPENVVYLAEAPVTNISSSFLRNAISNDFNVSQFLPAGVYSYIQETRLYK